MNFPFIIKLLLLHSVYHTLVRIVLIVQAVEVMLTMINARPSVTSTALAVSLFIDRIGDCPSRIKSVFLDGAIANEDVEGTVSGYKHALGHDGFPCEEEDLLVGIAIDGSNGAPSRMELPEKLHLATISVLCGDGRMPCVVICFESGRLCVAIDGLADKDEWSCPWRLLEI